MIVPDTIIPQLNIEWDLSLAKRRGHMSEARAAWDEYYRCVRILRSMRVDDPDRFKRFSSAWWKGSYRWECEKPRLLTVHARLVLKRMVCNTILNMTPEQRADLKDRVLNEYARLGRGYP